MYAIIETGGLQFKVAAGDIVTIPKIDQKEGAKVSFDKVLFVSDGKKIEVGTPCLKKVKVEAQLLRFFRGEKIISLKYKRRKHYERKKGFRRELAEVKIIKISEG